MVHGSSCEGWKFKAYVMKMHILISSGILDIKQPNQVHYDSTCDIMALLLQSVHCESIDNTFTTIMKSMQPE